MDPSELKPDVNQAGGQRGGGDGGLRSGDGDENNGETPEYSSSNTSNPPNPNLASNNGNFPFDVPDFLRMMPGLGFSGLNGTNPDTQMTNADNNSPTNGAYNIFNFNSLFGMSNNNQDQNTNGLSSAAGGAIDGSIGNIFDGLNVDIPNTALGNLGFNPLDYPGFPTGLTPQAQSSNQTSSSTSGADNSRSGTSLTPFSNPFGIALPGMDLDFQAPTAEINNNNASGSNSGSGNISSRSTSEAAASAHSSPANPINASTEANVDSTTATNPSSNGVNATSTSQPSTSAPPATSSSRPTAGATATATQHAPPLHRGNACLQCRRKKIKCDARRWLCGPCERNAISKGWELTPEGAGCTWDGPGAGGGGQGQGAKEVNGSSGTGGVSGGGGGVGRKRRKVGNRSGGGDDEDDEAEEVEEETGTRTSAATNQGKGKEKAATSGGGGPRRRSGGGKKVLELEGKIAELERLIRENVTTKSSSQQQKQQPSPSPPNNGTTSSGSAGQSHGELFDNFQRSLSKSRWLQDALDQGNPFSRANTQIGNNNVSSQTASGNRNFESMVQPPLGTSSASGGSLLLENIPETFLEQFPGLAAALPKGFPPQMNNLADQAVPGQRPPFAAAFSSHPGGSPSTSTPEKFSDIIWPGWHPSLPSPATVRLLVDSFFSKSHAAKDLVYKPKFLANFALPPTDPKFPHLSLIHGLCCIGARFLSKDLKGVGNEAFSAIAGANRYWASDPSPEDYHARCCKEGIDQGIVKGQKLLEVAQAIVCICFYSYGSARFVEVWLYCGLATRISTPLGLNHLEGSYAEEMNGIRRERTLERGKPSLLPPPVDDAERYERACTFWLAFCCDRYSQASTGWASSLDEADISTLLPTPLGAEVGSYTHADSPLSVGSQDFLTSHPPHMVTTFQLSLKATVLLGRTTTFLQRSPWPTGMNVARGVTASSDSKVQFVGKTMSTQPALQETIEYRRLDADIVRFRLSFPKEFSSILRKTDLGQLDTNLVTSHIIPHVCTILLHEPFIDPKTKATTNVSLARCLSSARAILSSIYLLWSSSHEITMLNPFVSFCWAVAGRTLVRDMSIKQFHGEEEQAKGIRQELDIIISAMLIFGQRLHLGLITADLLKRLVARPQMVWTSNMQCGPEDIFGSGCDSNLSPEEQAAAESPESTNSGSGSGSGSASNPSPQDFSSLLFDLETHSLPSDHINTLLEQQMGSSLAAGGVGGMGNPNINAGSLPGWR